MEMYAFNGVSALFEEVFFKKNENKIFHLIGLIVFGS